MSERTIKNIVVYGLIPSAGLGVAAMLMPAGPVKTVPEWISGFGIAASGMALGFVNLWNRRCF